MVTLKLTKDEYRRPVRFKERIIALGNYKSCTGLLLELYARVVFIELVQAVQSVVQVGHWSIRHVDLKRLILNFLLLFARSGLDKSTKHTLNEF